MQSAVPTPGIRVALASSRGPNTAIRRRHDACRYDPQPQKQVLTQQVTGHLNVKHTLILLNGPTPGTGLTVDETSDGITIGRDAGRTLPIDDVRCSRLNSRVWFDLRWNIEDCGSSNGTYVNSRRIERTVLRPGDVIRVGETLLVFSRERDTGDCRWQPRRLATSTFVMRVTEPDRRPTLARRLMTDGEGPVRTAAVLCQLAQDLYEPDDRDAMIQRISDAIVEAIGADTVTIWLAGPDGRLTAFGGRNTTAGQDDLHLFASLAIENNEAMLVQNGVNASNESTSATTSTYLMDSSDMVISVPIPGRFERRGAIECVRNSREGSFSEDDLDVVIAVAHQSGLAIENLDYREKLELANDQLRSTVHNRNRIIGSSLAIRELLDTIARVGPVDSTVLVKGESGTGKELVARMIHETSQHHAGPYIAINCAAFSESLLESELFGHEKGAFTGADQRRTGQFERAHHGTLFLDEIGEMSAACQARLLRILERHPFERVGGTDSIQVDVRVIAATHRNLPELVANGEFREDLYFRLRVIEMEMPPLRERGDDVLTLAEHFHEHLRAQIGRGPRHLSDAAREVLSNYSWPGNVRELRNAIERAVVLGRGEEISPFDLGLSTCNPPADAGGRLRSLAEAELRHIQSVLQAVNGNKTQACKVLGIGRGTLYKKLEELGH